ncbi:hypothetical protein Gotur_004978 [Gossypium turneri]
MDSHLKGVKKSTLTDEMRKALCEYKNEHPSSSQKDLQQWVPQTFDLSKVNMNGEMIQTKVKELLQKMYGDANSEFNFSIGWLERFKTRHGIKSYRRFGESGSIIMENIEYALPQIRAKLKIFYWKDIYNMDETGLFYRLQAYHSLARKQLEGRKKDKERLTIMVCYNRGVAYSRQLPILSQGY